MLCFFLLALRLLLLLSWRTRPRSRERERWARCQRNDFLPALRARHCRWFGIVAPSLFSLSSFLLLQIGIAPSSSTSIYLSAVDFVLYRGGETIPVLPVPRCDTCTGCQIWQRHKTVEDAFRPSLRIPTHPAVPRIDVTRGTRRGVGLWRWLPRSLPFSLSPFGNWTFVSLSVQTAEIPPLLAPQVQSLREERTRVSLLEVTCAGSGPRVCVQ